MRRPRFRTRTLMIAVAGASVVLWAALMVRRTAAFIRLARECAAAEARTVSVADGLWARAQACRIASRFWRYRARTGGGADAEMLRRSALAAEQAGLFERQAEESHVRDAPIAAHHARLAAKYRRAASHPWESVPPDPAPPE